MTFLKNNVLRFFWTICRFMAHPPHRGSTMILILLLSSFSSPTRFPVALRPADTGLGQVRPLKGRPTCLAQGRPTCLAQGLPTCLALPSPHWNKKKLQTARHANLLQSAWAQANWEFQGGPGCLGEGRLGVPGQVWEFRLLPSFPSFPRENRSSKMSGILLPDIRGLLKANWE